MPVAAIDRRGGLWLRAHPSNLTRVVPAKETRTDSLRGKHLDPGRPARTPAPRSSFFDDK